LFWNVWQAVRRSRVQRHGNERAKHMSFARNLSSAIPILSSAVGKTAWQLNANEDIRSLRTHLSWYLQIRTRHRASSNSPKNLSPNLLPSQTNRCLFAFNRMPWASPSPRASKRTSKPTRSCKPAAISSGHSPRTKDLLVRWKFCESNGSSGCKWSELT
jgi:hypothetical protein